jgi:hypothetical protein
VLAGGGILDTLDVPGIILLQRVAGGAFAAVEAQAYLVKKAVDLPVARGITRMGPTNAEVFGRKIGALLRWLGGFRFGWFPAAASELQYRERHDPCAGSQSSSVQQLCCHGFQS